MRAALALAALLTSTACVRPLTGGWEGDIDCDGVDADVAALFEAGDAIDELDGDVWVQAASFFGRSTFRTTVGDVDFDDQDAEWEIALHFAPEDDDEGKADYVARLQYADSDTELNGEVDILDDDGQRTDECTIDLQRVGEDAP